MRLGESEEQSRMGEREVKRLIEFKLGKFEKLVGVVYREVGG